MRWTPEKIKIAKEILGRHRNITAALSDIKWATFGTYVSYDALRRAFGRAGEENPKKLLGKDLKPISITDIPTSDVPGVKKEVTFGTSSFKETSNEFFIDIAANNFKNDLRRNSGLLDAVKAGKMKVQVVSTVNKKTTRIVVLPDTHIPYHDVKAWACALQVIRDTKPEYVVIIGDFSDVYSLSSHPKSLDRKQNFASEVAAVNAALDELRAAAGNDCKVKFCEGNHEDRITRFLQSNAPELGGITELRAEGLFKIKERGIEWVPYRRAVKIGNCSFTHDIGRCGVNTARQSLVDFGGNLVVGHSHRAGIAFQGESKGSSHFCLNVGWLGDVEGVDYQHRMRILRDWQHGLGIVDQDETGFSWPQFVPILEGRCVVDGKVISGQKAAS